MPPAGFEPTIPLSERPQTHALDRVATGIGYENHRKPLIYYVCKTQSLQMLKQVAQLPLLLKSVNGLSFTFIG
jgi:hypothetical protein